LVLGREKKFGAVGDVGPRISQWFFVFDFIGGRQAAYRWMFWVRMTLAARYCCFPPFTLGFGFRPATDRFAALLGLSPKPLSWLFTLH
jgi:hypothetical protein